MPISSLIVRTHEDMAEAAAMRINALPQASVTDVQAGNLVVITETRGQREDRILWETIEGMTEVHSLDAIYHNVEDLED